MALSVDERFWSDSAELGMDHPVKEVDEDELFSILGAEDQVLLWDLHTRDSVLMKKRVSE